MKKVLLLAVATVMMMSCAVTQAVQYPDQVPTKGKVVEAGIDHFNLLYLMPMSNVSFVTEELKKQCPTGQIKGVSTQFYSRFLYIGTMETVNAYGYCVE